MRKVTLLALGLTMIGSGTVMAEPGGCLKYGAAGGVAGHVAGHHGIAGAAAGCATGMVVRHHYRQGQRDQALQNMQGNQRSQGYSGAPQSTNR